MRTLGQGCLIVDAVQIGHKNAYRKKTLKKLKKVMKTRVKTTGTQLVLYIDMMIYKMLAYGNLAPVLHSATACLSRYLPNIAAIG